MCVCVHACSCVRACVHVIVDSTYMILEMLLCSLHCVGFVFTSRNKAQKVTLAAVALVGCHTRCCCTGRMSY